MKAEYSVKGEEMAAAPSSCTSPRFSFPAKAATPGTPSPSPSPSPSPAASTNVVPVPPPVPAPAAGTASAGGKRIVLPSSVSPCQSPPAPVSRFGTFHSRYCCASKHIQLMTASILHVNQSDTGSDDNPYRRRRHRWCRSRRRLEERPRPGWAPAGEASTRGQSRGAWRATVARRPSRRGGRWSRRCRTPPPPGCSGTSCRRESKL
jgi:hypothetical protein